MLINGIDVNIKLTCALGAFCLFAPSDDNNARIKNLDATLIITQV